jgi:NADPH:quinone reductase-like Zn-dependent oxidoreductase
MPNLALQVDHDAQASIALNEIDEPKPAPDEVVVGVAHAAANFAELRFAPALPNGMTLGYDAAGVVVQEADDGSGPPVGTRVVAFGPGAWAQRAVFKTDSIAVVPDSVGLADAAAIPMVGLTALRTLRSSGSLLDRKVLITGASGGVGRAAIQLASLGGAVVTAVSGSPQRADRLLELGATRVVGSLDEVAEPQDIVLENVGGPTLLAAWKLLGPGGIVHSIGWACGEPAELPVNAFFVLGPARTLSSFGDMVSPGTDLAYLIGLVEAGPLLPEIGWQGPWTDIDSAAAALAARQVPGKIVIDLPEAGG